MLSRYNLIMQIKFTKVRPILKSTPIWNYRIGPERSLNSASNNNKSYAWSEQYYQCHCPSENDDVDDEEIVYESSRSKRLNKYIGLLYCTMDRPCVVEHEGQNWTGSLLPDYALKDISLTVNYLNVNNEKSLAFVCSFDAQDTLLYNITW